MADTALAHQAQQLIAGHHQLRRQQQHNRWLAGALVAAGGAVLAYVAVVDVGVHLIATLIAAALLTAVTAFTATVRRLRRQDALQQRLRHDGAVLGDRLVAHYNHPDTWAGVMDQFANCNDPTISKAARDLDTRAPHPATTGEHVKADLVSIARNLPAHAADLTDIFTFIDMAGEHAVTLHNNYLNTRNTSLGAFKSTAQHLTTREQAHSAARLSTNWHGSIQELLDTAVAITTTGRHQPA